MIKKLALILCLFIFTTTLSSCTSKSNDKVKIGVSFGVGNATRWKKEKAYMEEQAAELGIDIEVRLNKTDTPKTQEEDCAELIDSGVDVLILTPRDVNNVNNILAYAKKNKVPVINYARIVSGEKVDLFVGYDSNRLGQSLGQYISEMVYEGDYIILNGDKNDSNSSLVYNGAMRYIDPIKDSINILLDDNVPNWSPSEAKEVVIQAIISNNNNIDAILALNDTLAAACAEAITELGITKQVSITGMDAELGAIKRIVNGTQDVTIYMDLQYLATTAINEAYNIATNQRVNVNSEFDNNNGDPIDANLITGKLVTRENLDKIIIDGGVYTYEEVYGE